MRRSHTSHSSTSNNQETAALKALLAGAEAPPLRAPKTVAGSNIGSKRVKLIEAIDDKTKQRDQARHHWAKEALPSAGRVRYFDFISKLPEAMEKLTDYSCSNEEAAILSNFIQFSDLEEQWLRQVDPRVQLPHAVQLWTLIGFKRSDWLAGLGANETECSVESVHTLLQDINGDGDKGEGAKVVFAEAAWVCSMAAAYGKAGSDPNSTSLLVAIAHWTLTCRKTDKGEIVRAVLQARLGLEAEMRYGCFRLWMLFILFTLLIGTISVASKIHQCRSIQDVFVSSFDLGALEEISSLEGVKDFMTGFSASSADMSPVSLTNFGEAGSIKILAEPETFDEPVVTPQFDLRLRRSFTLQAWLQLEHNTIVPKGGLPIFRRALKAVGAGSDLSCLRWNFPPSLSFGAQDYGMKVPNAVTELDEEFVKVTGSSEYDDLLMNGGIFQGVETNTLTMFVVTVSTTNLTFYRNNGEELSTHSLARMVTDCAGGVNTVGAKGLYLATLQYIPRALSQHEVKEIYQQGGLLGDTGFNIHAPTLSSLTHLKEIANYINDNKAWSDDANVFQKRQTEAQNVLSVLATQNPYTVSSPYSNLAHVPTIGTDPILGIQVWTIFDNIFVNGQSQIQMEGNALPQITADKGFAISVWLKFKQSGNGFLMSRGIPVFSDGEYKFVDQNDRCWSVYIGGGATEIVVRSSKTGEDWGAGAFISDLDATEDSQFRGLSWRHFFIQMDPTAAGAKTKLCIDGECEKYASLTNAGEESGPPADCEGSSYTAKRYPNAADRDAALNRTKYFIFRRPPAHWPLTAHVKNFKMFDRALTEVEQENLRMNDPDPEDPSKKMSGCKNPADLIDDSSFRDDFGHNCLWYYNTRIDGLPNCERNPEAGRKCPVACASVEVCWGKNAALGDSDVFNIWDQQMEIHSKSTWGTTCVAKSTTAAKEAIKCGLNAPNFVSSCAELKVQQCAPVDCSAFEFDKESLIKCLGDVVWTQNRSSPPENRFLPCAQIVETHVPSCDWDDTGLDEVASKISTSGEYSMMFWVESIQTDGCLQPRMAFVDGDGLTFAWMAGWEEVVLDPPGGKGCNENVWYSFDGHGTLADGYRTISGADVEPNVRPKPGKKHLILLGRTSSPNLMSVSFDAKTNNGGGAFDRTMQVPPLKPDKNFLRVINIGGNVRMSAIRIMPSFPQPGAIANYRYVQEPAQALRRGSDPSLRKQLETSVERDTDLFKYKTMLVSPPLLIQTRKEAAACEWDFSQQVVNKYYEVAGRAHCEDPYSCSNFAKKNVYQCPAGAETDLFFGLKPMDITGEAGYVEFLASITNSPIVVRLQADDTRAVLQTGHFIDTLTSELKIASLFYSPMDDITTSLLISFTFDQKGISADFELRNYVAVTGSDFTLFVVYQWVLMLLVELFMFWDLLANLKNLHEDRQRHGKWNKPRLVLFFFDLAIQLVTIAYLIANHVIRAETGPETERLMGNLVNTTWDSTTTEFQTKKSFFLDTFNELDAKILRADRVERFGLVTASLIFLRLIAATSVHPRIAIIGETVKVALSDMAHFFAIFLLVLYGFSVIGWWRFGRERTDFESIGSAMKTLIDATLGPPGEIPLYNPDDGQWDYLIFCLLTHLVNFFFLINFFLAIVVDSYGTVCIATDDFPADQDALTDFLAMMQVCVLKFRYKWPSDQDVMKALKEDIVDNHVSVEDLKQYCNFPTPASAQAYYDYYNGYDFMHEEQEKLTLEDVKGKFDYLTAQMAERGWITIDTDHQHAVILGGGVDSQLPHIRQEEISENSEDPIEESLPQTVVGVIRSCSL